MPEIVILIYGIGFLILLGLLIYFIIQRISNKNSKISRTEITSCLGVYTFCMILIELLPLKCKICGKVFR